MIPTGHQIYLKRLERKWTQGELARRAGIGQPNLSNIEACKQDVTIATLRKIVYALDLPLVEFFRDEGADPRKRRTVFTREAIERLARVIVEGRGRRKQEEEEIAALFRRIIPVRSRKDVRVRQTQEAWLKLKLLLTPGEIKTICERVQDFRMRLREEKRS